MHISENRVYLNGWKEIQAYVRAKTGIEPESLKRLHKRHRIPVQKLSAGRSAPVLLKIEAFWEWFDKKALTNSRPKQP